ncbi:SNF2 domain protein [Tasmannia lanceolata]|uniref:SNF2 domain protein n=1 Tax=Tasmannia lanceolata TaxID=3420 RepID=UPI004062F444
MDEVLVESAIEAKTPNFSLLIGEKYETLLKESIDRFLHESRKEKCDFSDFRSIFFRLLQSRVDPPLEIIWFYSAVSFYETRVSENGVLSRVLTARDLFQLLAACSASCNGVKSIALIAPVLFKLHCSVIESDFEKPSKTVKKLRREIEGLLEGVLGYVSICSSKDSDENDGSVGLVSCFPDLIRVWIVNRLERDCEVREGLRVFFPLISDEILDGFGDDGFGTGFLAGVVMVEAFLMRLCLKVRDGVSKSELKEELRIWAVGSITAFRNCVFFEILLRLLLEPTLPVTSLLGSEDEILLREVLYDAVILVDYSFLYSETTTEHSNDQMKSLAMTRLIAAHEAIRVARANGNHTKAISYINAFSRSQLPSEIVKWVISQIGMEKPSKPDGSTPQAVLKWLLNLEDQGLGMFVNGISNLRTKFSLDESNVGYEHPIFKPDVMKVDEEDLFYIDNKGEHVEKGGEEGQEMQSMDTKFLAAARTMKFTANDGRRKRKEKGGEGEIKVKFLKYRLHDSSVKGNFTPSRADEMSSGSEVENPISDADMEETEQ